MSRRVAALGVLLGLFFGVLLVGGGPASAHASVVSSSPVDGSRLKAAPTVVTITFDEPVSLGSVGYLHVTDQSGRKVDAGPAYHPNGNGAQIADKLKSGLGDGTYTESFRIISADSHPVAGTVRFVVGNGVLSASAVAGSTVNHATSVALDAARWLSFVGFALVIGTWLVIVAWQRGRGERRVATLAWTGVGAAALGAVLEVLLQGPYTAGTGISHLADWSLIDGTLHTDYGRYHCVRLVLLGVTAVYLAWALQAGRQRRRVEALAVLLGGALALTFSATGHAATTSPHWLSITSDLLHITAMGVWLGGLVVVVAALLPRADTDELRVALPVFSRVAFLAIVTLAVTGTYAAWRGVGELQALFTTTYGWLVVLKVVLFAGIVMLGNLGRLFLRRRDPATGTERLRRSVLVEVVLAIGVLVATSVLVAEPRGKEAVAVAQARPRSASVSIGGGRVATVTFDPGKHGDIRTTVELSAGPQPQQVTATATLPSKQIGPIPLGLTAAGRNLYGSSGVLLPAAGTWVVQLVVTTSQFSAVTATVRIHLY